MTIPSATQRHLHHVAGAPAQKNAKAWATAVDFEAQFLKTMLEQAFAGLSGEGPLGGEGTGAEAWRSFLIEEHVKGMAGRSHLGIADAVYRDTIKRMENRNG